MCIELAYLPHRWFLVLMIENILLILALYLVITLCSFTCLSAILQNDVINYIVDVTSYILQ